MSGSGAFWFNTDPHYLFRCLRIAYIKIVRTFRKRPHKDLIKVHLVNVNQERK